MNPLKRTLRGGLVLIMTFSMTAQGSWMPDLPKWLVRPVKLELPEGKPYFPSCDSLVEAMESQTIFEDYIVSQASTDEERMQLMADYGMFFTREFHTSLRLALEDRGVKLSVPGTDSSGDYPYKQTKPLREFVTAVNKVFQLPDDEFDQFIFDTFQYMHDQAAGDNDESKAKVVSLQLTQFFHAIKDPKEWKDYGPIVRTGFRSLLAHSLTTYSRKLTVSHEANYNEPSLWWGIAPAVIHFFVYMFVPWWGEPPRDSWDSQYFDAFGANLLTHIGGLVPAFFAPYFSLTVFNKTRRYGRWAKKYATGPNRVTLTRAIGTDYAKEFKLLSENYSETVADMVVSMDRACKEKNICTLTPVQVAYIGHYDLLRIQAQAKVVEEQVNALGFDGLLGEIEKAAVALREQPNSYRKQTDLIRYIHSYTRDFAKHKKSGDAAVKALKKQITDVQSNLEKLRLKPYDFDPDDHNEDMIMKNELLLAKLASDLESLQALNLNQDELLARNGHMEPFVNELEEILKKLRLKDPDWKALADESRMTLDKMKLGGE